jgi:hypothetical protein
MLSARQSSAHHAGNKDYTIVNSWKFGENNLNIFRPYSMVLLAWESEQEGDCRLGS